MSGREPVTTTGAFASSDQQVAPSHRLFKTTAEHTEVKQSLSEAVQPSAAPVS